MADKKPLKMTKGVTPKGVAAWPHLNKPDEYKGKKSYKVNLKLTAEDSEKLIALIDKETEKVKAETIEKLEDTVANGKTGEAKKKAKDALAKLTVGVPYTAAVDDDGDETGDYVFKFKANAEFEDRKTGQIKPITIPLFDAKKKPTKVAIWGGSTIKVAYALVPYYVASANSCGVSLRIEGVQVIDLVSSGGGRSAEGFGFGEEDGFESEDSDDDSDSADNADSDEDSDDDSGDF